MHILERAFRPSCWILGLLLSIAGCHTPLMDVTIVNQGPALHLMEFDYPSASFGTDVIPPGGRYHYRFRIQGSGPLTLHFSDGSGKSYTAQGPVVREGQQGSVTVTVTGPSAQWNLKLAPGK